MSVKPPTCRCACRSSRLLIGTLRAGLRPGLDCYRLCSAGWDHYLASLAAYAETGAGQPFGSPAIARP